MFSIDIIPLKVQNDANTACRTLTTTYLHAFIKEYR